MGEGFWQRFSELGKKNGLSKRPPASWIVAGLAAGILLMFVSARPAPQASLDSREESSEVLAPVSLKADYREKLERELADRLRRVKGVKDVAVLITLESGPVHEYAQNRETTERSTQEEDSSGGRRRIDEKTTRSHAVVTREGNGEQALTVREMQPKIAGVMVVVRGGGDPVLLERIARAVSAALNLPMHRIDVLPME